MKTPQSAAEPVGQVTRSERNTSTRFTGVCVAKPCCNRDTEFSFPRPLQMNKTITGFHGKNLDCGVCVSDLNSSPERIEVCVDIHIHTVGLCIYFQLLVK